MGGGGERTLRTAGLAGGAGTPASGLSPSSTGPVRCGVPGPPLGRIPCPPPQARLCGPGKGGRGSQYSSLQDGPGREAGGHSAAPPGPHHLTCAKETNKKKYKSLPGPRPPSPRSQAKRHRRAGQRGGEYKRGPCLKSLPQHRAEKGRGLPAGLNSKLSVEIYQSWHSDPARGGPGGWKLTRKRYCSRGLSQ